MSTSYGNGQTGRGKATVADTRHVQSDLFTSISSDTATYLDGSAFSNGYRMNLATARRIRVTRTELLCSLAEGKKVIHVGCCDHAGLIADKVKAGEWLHERLTNAAHQCLGIDINADAVQAVRERGFSNVVCVDVMNPAALSETIGGQWDFAVFGDVIEHVDNPVAFLTAAANSLRPHVASIVVSVPNAFCWENFWSVLRREECVNSDHRYWFTPFTLAKVLVQSGYEPSGFLFVEAQNLRGRGLSHRLVRTALRVSPALSSTLVMTANIRPHLPTTD